MYNFIYVDPEQYASELFLRKSTHAYFYLACHLSEDIRRPILELYTPEQRKTRDEYCKGLINFVKRRDLDKEYVRTYEGRMREVWKFVSPPGIIPGMSPNNELSSDDSEDEVA
jgi:hypothetical protein